MVVLFFSVVVVREDWRSGRCDPSTDFWTRNSALIQSVVVVVVAAVFFNMLGVICFSFLIFVL